MTCVTFPPSIQVVKFLESDPEIRIDPMATIFPRVTKCSYYKYGPSGTVQTHDAICVLVRSERGCVHPIQITQPMHDESLLQPINIMNEKIFVFIWFWLVVLSCVTVLSLLYHLFVMMTPSVTKVGSGPAGFDQQSIHLSRNLFFADVPADARDAPEGPMLM